MYSGRQGNKGKPEDARQVIVVTCIQEHLDNSRLTVRLGGKVLGRVVQDGHRQWLVLPPEQPRPKSFTSLADAVDALVHEELGNAST